MGPQSFFTIMQLSVEISSFYKSSFVKNWKYLAEFVLFFISCDFIFVCELDIIIYNYTLV